MPATERSPSGHLYTPFFALTFSDLLKPLVFALCFVQGGYITHRLKQIHMC